MQEEKELNEVLEMMVEKMLAMDKRIGELNEKQNSQADKGNDNDMPGEARSDASKQIPFGGL